MNVPALLAEVRASRGFGHKHDLAAVLEFLCRGTAAPASGPGPLAGTSAAMLGDDCAVLPDAGGHLLFAIEGLVDDFVKRMPWFAGYCGVMVNVSDIYAMGGRPLAVVDALWSCGRDAAAQILAGMRAAAQRYAVPIVGGHTNQRHERGQLAVAILGRATRLLSSFAARPGDSLVMAVDLRGAYAEPYAYWNASTEAPAERLRADLELLPQLAEAGMCDAAKDISMAGALGTLLMLLECSRVGAMIDLEPLPRPVGTHGHAAWLRWLTAFPSYGFLLSVRPVHVPRVLQAFQQRELAAAVVGQVTAARRVTVSQGTGLERGEPVELWDFTAHPFMAPPLPESHGAPLRRPESSDA